MCPQDDSLESPIGVPRLQEIYSRTAAFYDGLVAEQQSAAKLKAIELLDRHSGERFLEAGAGTGWAFAHIVSASGEVNAIALDVAPGMLEVARARLLEEAGLRSPPLVLGDCLALPFADDSFDCLLSSYTLEVLPNDLMAPVLREYARVIRPGGRIVLVNLTDGEGEDAAITDDWKRRFAVDPEYFGGARPQRLAPILSDVGFINVTRTYVGPDWPSEVLLGFRPS